MKEKFIFGIVLILSTIIGFTNDPTETFLLVEPFYIFGGWLREMSLNGGFLNILAWFLFIIVTLIPGYVFIYKFIKSKYDLVDMVMLPILAISLGFSIYAYINPQFFISHTSEPYLLYNADNFDLISLILNGAFAVVFELVLILYGVLKIYLNKEMLLNKTIYISFVLMISFVIILGFGSVLPLDYDHITNAENSYVKTLYIFEIIFNITTYGIMIYLLISIRDFITKLNVKEISDEVMHANHNNLFVSKVLVMVIIFSQIFINVYQMIFIYHINSSTFTISFPMLIFVLTLIFIVFSKHFEKVHSIKEENELFI